MTGRPTYRAAPIHASCPTHTANRSQFGRRRQHSPYRWVPLGNTRDRSSKSSSGSLLCCAAFCISCTAGSPASAVRLGDGGCARGMLVAATTSARAVRPAIVRSFMQTFVGSEKLWLVRGSKPTCEILHISLLLDGRCSDRAVSRKKARVLWVGDLHPPRSAPRSNRSKTSDPLVCRPAPSG